MQIASMEWGDYTHEPDLARTELEQQARIRKTSLSTVLNLAVRDWLKQSAATIDEV
jgi:hypothetical protein